MKKLIKLMPIVLVICIIFVSTYATVTVPNATQLKGNAAQNISSTARNLWSTVVTVVQILAVGAVVFAGVRYMFASADQKADIKKSMGILAIGAVLVFGATTILQLIANATTNVVNTAQ